MQVGILECMYNWPQYKIFFCIRHFSLIWKKGRLRPKNYFCTTLRQQLFKDLYFWSHSERCILKSCGVQCNISGDGKEKSNIKLCQKPKNQENHKTTQMSQLNSWPYTLYIGYFISQLTTLLSILHNTNWEIIKYLYKGLKRGQPLYNVEAGLKSSELVQNVEPGL